MGKIQKYGIKYPFTSDNNEGVFMDLNNNIEESVKSRVLHVIFTPKGQKLRDPNFGTNLIKYIFNDKNSLTFNELKNEISSQVIKYVPEVEFKDIRIYESEENEHAIIVSIDYGVKMGNKIELTSVSIKL